MLGEIVKALSKIKWIVLIFSCSIWALLVIHMWTKFSKHIPVDNNL